MPNNAPDPAAPYWTTRDVAAYLGVQPRTVSTYVFRSQIPAPDEHVGRTPVWQPGRVIEWHQTRPKAPHRRKNTQSPN